MKKNIIFAFLTLIFFCSNSLYSQKKGFYENVQKKHVSKVLDDLNTFAATADFKNYFALYAEESTFVGTDANEVWNKKEFMDYAKPHFDKGKAWSFKAIERNIYISNDQKTVWFDELLDTQMKICRGSGVLIFEKGSWKIKHYVLSMTIPNQISKDVIPLKTPIDDKITLQKKK